MNAPTTITDPWTKEQLMWILAFLIYKKGGEFTIDVAELAVVTEIVDQCHLIGRTSDTGQLILKIEY